MQKTYFTITTPSLNQMVTENADEALQAYHNGWQVIKTSIIKTFTKYSSVKVEVTSEIMEETEIKP